MERVPNEDLVTAALEMMASVGKPLRRISTGTRAMKYVLDDGKTVRVRTCNDPVLVVLASSTDEDAGLNIEGTDYLLIAMPQQPRTAGAVVAYFLPTAVAAKDVREAHIEWLRSGPATKGNNRTWNVWFKAGPVGCSGFAERWAMYRLPAPNLELKHLVPRSAKSSSKENLGEVIARARAQISAAAGVPVEAVKIHIVVD